ncbi:MAG: hypothetical protein AAFP84_21635 [Actinomycetota bacterium]
MPVTFTDGITIDDPSVVIDGIEFKCTSRSAMLTGEDDVVDKSNYCDPKGTRPGATDWQAEFELELSYGIAGGSVDGNETDAGTWNTIHGWRKQRKTFVIRPSEASAVADDNPAATFDAYVPTIDFMNSEVAATETQRFTLTVTPIGDPVFATS